MHWYAHLTWTAPADHDPQGALTRLARAVQDLEQVPGALGYVLAPDDTTWRAGFAVTAPAIEDAAAAAVATLRAAALDAGHLDVDVTAVEVLGETHRDRWTLTLPPLQHPAS